MGVSKRLAAIDIGTVTTRLLVADVAPGSIVEVARSTDITHLGEGLSATGRLSEAAMERVAAVIARYSVTIASLDVAAVTAFATSASRDADNADEFLALLARHSIVPEIIPGDREAALSFPERPRTWDSSRTCWSSTWAAGPRTDLRRSLDEDGARVPRIDKARSIDVGSKRVTELFLHSDPPLAEQLSAARDWATVQLRPFFAGLRDRPRQMVALAGTATSLSAIRQGLAIYDPQLVHCSCLTGSELADLTEMLAAMPLAERELVPGLDPGRAPVIVAGALILETVVALAGLESTLVSEHDILYGILLDTYRTLQGSDREV